MACKYTTNLSYMLQQAEKEKESIRHEAFVRLGWWEALDVPKALQPSVPISPTYSGNLATEVQQTITELSQVKANMTPKSFMSASTSLGALGMGDTASMRKSRS